LRQHIDALVVAFGQHALADVHRHPARIEEQPFAVFDHTSPAPEQLHFLLERIRDAHGPDIVPEGRVGPLGRVIMEDQEIADPVIFGVDQPVEFVAVGGRDLPLRK
jgi:hypothetical protein